MISFTVIGIPAPQGSKTPWGQEANKNTKPWRATVAADGTVAMQGRPLLDEPVRVWADFYFPRPKSHYRSGKYAHLVRDDAPVYVAGKPDLDKLQRAIGDALTGTVLRDDSRIAGWVTNQLYGEPARAVIKIIPIAKDQTDANPR